VLTCNSAVPLNETIGPLFFLLIAPGSQATNVDLGGSADTVGGCRLTLEDVLCSTHPNHITPMDLSEHPLA